MGPRARAAAARHACIFTSSRNKAGDGVVYPFGGFDWLTACRLWAGKAAPPTLAASARATNTAVWLKRGGQRAEKRLRARRAPVTSRSRHATISRRAAHPSPLTLNPLQRHTSRRRVKEKLWPAAAGSRFVGVERIGFGVASSWRGAAKNQPPARTDKRADAAREKGNAVTNRERYRFFSALFKKVLAVNCSNGSVFLFSQIPSLKSVCLPSINSCGKAAAK